MRYALGIEYDGSGFFGWQSQLQSPTVQETVEQALSAVADSKVSVVCAGRTDTGVHARCQVAHFDTSAERSDRSWILGTNSRLPDSVSVLWVQAAGEEFHARFSAFERSYRYTICNRWVRPAIGRKQMTWHRRPLDGELMHRAAQSLRGEHDFSAFRSSGCRARHAVREITQISVEREGDLVCIDVSANGFLYHMVRNIAGSLMEIGAGVKPVDWMQELLDGRDRTRAGVTAPPEGLCFVGVLYPEYFGLPLVPAAFPKGQEYA
jgi:tRNA pseudouridine38-40 synthase